MPDQQPPSTALPEPLAGLDDAELETLAQLARQQNAAQQPATPSQPGGPSMGRRGLLAGGGLGLLGLLASAGGASAAADPNDGDGDLGNGGPWDVWVDGLALVTQDVSTSTTVDKPIVRYDSTLGTLTLTIDSSLEGPAGFSQPMWFLDQTGNADTNPVTVKDSSGTTIATIPAENSIFSPVWDGSEWLTTRFIESLNAGTVTADSLSIAGTAAGPRATGTYTGDGTESNSITGVGFQPIVVVIFQSVGFGTTETAEIWVTTDTVIDNDASGAAYNLANGDARHDKIISLDSDGFTVDDNGADEHPNKNGEGYDYIAIG